MVCSASPTRVLPLVACLLLPAAASAQEWLDAYQAHDYVKASALLHDVVTEPDYLLRAPDPGPLRLLAHLYGEGLGVPRDPIAACALAEDVDFVAVITPPKKPAQTLEDFVAYEAGLKEAHDFAEDHCRSLSAADRLTASRTRGGCYSFGMPEQILTVGTEAVRIGRSGITLGHTPRNDAGSLMCLTVVAGVRSRTIDVPEDAATWVKPRHFIELFAWRRIDPIRAPAGAVKYGLVWQVFEVRGREVPMIADQALWESPSWPAPGLPDDLDGRLTFEMVRSGHVRWRIEGAPPMRGWLMLPDTKRP